MNRGDISVIGVNGGNHPYRFAASATRTYPGEPQMFTGTYSSGVASANTITPLTDGKPVIGTDNFVGILAKDQSPLTGTVVACTVQVTVPIPQTTRIRGRGKSKANVDTDSELLGILWDYLLFDLTAGVYTIDDTAAADTSALLCVDGVIPKGLLDVIADVRAFRVDIS